MMKKIVITTLLLIGMGTVSNAQDYTTGIGIRGGLYNGIAIKHFIGIKSAFEVILATRWQGYNITGLYEIHTQAFNTPHLNFYYGFGGHLGVWNGANVSWVNDNLNHTVIGVDGILGLEYNFKEVPFNISVDWKPALNLIGYSGFWGDNGALSFRYIF